METIHKIVRNEVHERSRFKLVNDLCWFFLILLTSVGLINQFIANYNPAPDYSGAICSGLCLIFLKKSRNYRWVAMFSALSSFIIIAGAFLTMNALHYTTPLWMIIGILFTFFILGRKWGVFILSAHFIVLFVYIFFFMNENIQAIKPYNKSDLFLFIVEFCLIAIAIGYILFSYIKTATFSEQSLHHANTLLIQQNNLISKQNSEMEVMMKEIHHRVKNNLQIIASLLRLQSNQSNSNFDEAVNRVNAMAMIHEKMYQSETLSGIDLERYVTSLLDSLLESYALNNKVSVHLEIDIPLIHSAHIVPFALLLNELISNTMKHAFEAQPKPEIRITILENAPKGIVFFYADNGKWKKNATESFGSEIIEAMTQQLEGRKELIISEVNGTKYTFHLLT